MTRAVPLEELRAHLQEAQQRLTREKHAILHSFGKDSPLEKFADREAYAFAYRRAERVGMEVLQRRLEELSWLPVRLDTSAEKLKHHRAALKSWLKADTATTPVAAFGNEFMHALTRCALMCGWDSTAFARLAARIAHLFCELSCLVGAIYYCNLLAESRTASVPLRDPTHLGQTVAEMATLMRLPSFLKELRPPTQTHAIHRLSSSAAKGRPLLRVIEGGLPLGDPLPAH